MNNIKQPNDTSSTTTISTTPTTTTTTNTTIVDDTSAATAAANTTTTPQPTPVASSYWSRLTSYFSSSQYADTTPTSTTTVTSTVTSTTTTATVVAPTTLSTNESLPGAWPTATVELDENDATSAAELIALEHERQQLRESFNELALSSSTSMHLAVDQQVTNACIRI